MVAKKRKGNYSLVHKKFLQQTSELIESLRAQVTALNEQLLIQKTGDLKPMAQQNWQKVETKVESPIIVERVAVHDRPSGGSPTPAQGPHVEAIPRMASILSSLQDSTNNRLDELEKRLNPILISTPPKAALTGASPAPPFSCSVTDDLDSKIHRQRRIIDRLEDLIDRLAL